MLTSREAAFSHVSGQSIDPALTHIFDGDIVCSKTMTMYSVCYNYHCSNICVMYMKYLSTFIYLSYLPPNNYYCLDITGSTSLLALISRVVDQFGPKCVSVSNIQMGNIYVSLRKIPSIFLVLPNNTLIVNLAQVFNKPNQ